MSEPDKPGGDARFSLARWSKRKRAAARGERADDAPGAAAPPVVPAATVASPAPPSAAPDGAGAPASAVDAPPPAPLPPVESLTFDSDFTPFMQGGVDADVRRAAVRKLLRDPRFNVMDGLDVYIDDYSQPDPIPPEMLARLAHSVATLNPQGPGLDVQGGKVSLSGGDADAPGDGRAGQAPASGADAATHEAAHATAASAVNPQAAVLARAEDAGAAPDGMTRMTPSAAGDAGQSATSASETVAQMPRGGDKR